MQFKDKIRNILFRLDKISPYPALYPFIMSTEEKAVFDEAINGSRHYLEFGLGGSTLRAIQKSRAQIYTVESSPEWISHMKKYLILRYLEDRRVRIFLVNIGPTQKWGYPEQDNDKNLFENYSSKIFESIDSRVIDLVLVDGRFRVACTLKTILFCYKNKNIKILIHDFWNREHYHILLKYLDVEKRVDTLGLFTIKPGVDINMAQKDYECYKLNPK